MTHCKADLKHAVWPVQQVRAAISPLCHPAYETNLMHMCPVLYLEARSVTDKSDSQFVSIV